MEHPHRPLLQLLVVVLFALCGARPPSREAAAAAMPADAPSHTTAAVRRPIAFDDVSVAAGIVDYGISFGASAGDCDGDGWVDIFTSGHYMAHARLWHNNGDGTFTDIASHAMTPPPSGDLHAAQWADIDNDGTQELVVLRGASYGFGSEPKRLYQLVGTQFVDVAPTWGLDVPLMRARTPLGFDQDGDGRLDFFLTALHRPDGRSPPSLYQQEAGLFRDAGPGTGFSLPFHTLFGVLGDLDGDHCLDVLFQGYRGQAYSLASSAMPNITSALALPAAPTTNDVVIADFTGDGENEVYLARAPLGSQFHRAGPLVLEFCAKLLGTEHEVRFGVAGPHFLWVDWEERSTWPASSVFLGAQGYHPPPFGFPLDPANPANTGIAPHVPGQDFGIWIGWDPVAHEWSVACSSPTQSEAMVRTIASAPIGAPYAIGFDPNPPSPLDLLLTRVNGQYVDITAASGIPASLRGISAVAADFDNDMDLDLYVVTSTVTNNTPNVLLENLGGGVFAPVAAGPAVGSLSGVGDCAITLDYDRDGSVDLFLVNGGATAFRQSGAIGSFGDDGPAQLLRNITANGNHWLALDLVGTTSNRDGIGARIEVTAGGVTQVREHGGGMHRFAQNHGIHFGLGANSSATRVEVQWPSGKRTVLTGVAADQYLTVSE